MTYRNGTKLTDRLTGDVFVVYRSTPDITHYRGEQGEGYAVTGEIDEGYVVAPPMLLDDDDASALSKQVGGDHYKKLGAYQPWKVLEKWLTPEEFRGYMKGNTIVYLARERAKGGLGDIEKAAHTLAGMIELDGGAV